MEIKQGTNRFVLVFKYFVIKFPKVNKSFFRNLLINCLEFFCFIIYRSDFCMPTYFSLLGFVNFQKKGNKTSYSDKEACYLVINILDACLKKYITENKISDQDKLILGHDTSSVRNLFWDSDCLKTIDYGSWPMFKFVIKSRKELILKKPA
ncbi:MAG: hypothetical protein WAW11_02855 [Patescibacteria group bacterium]